jgi:hypothetical protein
MECACQTRFSGYGAFQDVPNTYGAFDPDAIQYGPGTGLTGGGGGGGGKVNWDNILRGVGNVAALIGVLGGGGGRRADAAAAMAAEQAAAQAAAQQQAANALLFQQQQAAQQAARQQTQMYWIAGLGTVAALAIGGTAIYFATRK